MVVVAAAAVVVVVVVVVKGVFNLIIILISLEIKMKCRLTMTVIHYAQINNVYPNPRFLYLQPPNWNIIKY